MNILKATGIVVMIVALASVQAFACTATSTVDKARANKDTDTTNAARDVAEEMIDEEGWTNDTYDDGGAYDRNSISGY